MQGGLVTNTSASPIYQKLRRATEAIQSRTPLKPRIGLILGSGLGPIADTVQDKITIPYGEIPDFHATSVEGHAGEMILGHFEGIPCVFLKGRFHLYEGYPMEDVVFPTRTLCALGIQTLVITNAAGGVNTRFRPCDLMVITDHLNLMGDNPLKGPHLAELGPRFPDMTEAYHTHHIETLIQAGRSLDIDLKTGVYAGLLGPTYETPAEVRMLRTLGADAVGMSTVPECIAANHLGVQVAGICSITNLAAGLSSNKLSHKEVIENSKLAAEKMTQLLKKAIPQFLKQN